MGRGRVRERGGDGRFDVGEDCRGDGEAAGGLPRARLEESILGQAEGRAEDRRGAGPVEHVHRPAGVQVHVSIVQRPAGVQVQVSMFTGPQVCRFM